MTDEKPKEYNWHSAECVAATMLDSLHDIYVTCKEMLPRFKFRGFDGRENFVLGVTEDYCIMLTWWDDGYPFAIEIMDAIKIMRNRGYLVPDDFEEV